MPSSFTVLLVALLLSHFLSGCFQSVENSPNYQSACHGPQLRTLEQRNQAQEDGYKINPEYKCIDKSSYNAVSEQRAKWSAANTPEAITKQKSEREKMIVEERAHTTAVNENTAPMEPPPQSITLKRVDANTATEAEIASIPHVSATVASQIIEERAKRRFSNWADLVARVVGLSAAQTSLYASACGLTVDGQSLLDEPSNTNMAAQICGNFHAGKHP